MNAQMMQQSPHQAVLEATPDTDEGKAKLIEELQSRGRAAVGAKSWMDAKLLYEKALAVILPVVVDDEDEDDEDHPSASSMPTCDKNRVAILHSNLSLVQKFMGDFESARRSGEAATQADPTYVKGWWRLGQALQQLHRSSEALTALTNAKELDPTNKALLKELQKVQQQQKVEEEAKRLKEQARAEQEAQEQMEAMDVDPVAPTTAATRAPKPAAVTKKSTTTTSTAAATTTTTTTTLKDHVDDEKDLFTTSDAVRGYKVVNGKKTSYFHNELSEEAKHLIGDIAPKKLDTVPTPATAGARGGTTKGVSAWNTAGTWEEKNVTKWATQSLEDQILQTSFVLPASSPAPGALVTVTKVTTLDGHASFALARGKKRYIYEFMAKLTWQLTGAATGGDDATAATAAAAASSGSEDPLQQQLLDCHGTLALPDIDGTIEMGEGYEIHDFSIDSVSDNSVRPLIERFVQRGGFHEALNESIDDWVRQFKQEY